jgi:hypothetical protein
MRADALKMNLAVVLGTLLVLALGRTLRVGKTGGEDPEKGVIYTFWHGGMLVPLFTERRKRISILVSQHRDGEVVSRIARILGFEVVRGSTTRGGARAAREMLKRAKSGRCLAVTPDGPRGPRHVFQQGAVKLAQLTGLPILPVGIGVERRKELSSWDRFIIPAPFSRCVYAFGEPILVKREDDASEVAAMIGNKMVELTEAADSYFLKR